MLYIKRNNSASLVYMIIYFPAKTLHASFTFDFFISVHTTLFFFFFYHILLISSNFILHIPSAHTLAFSLSKASFVLRISYFGQTQPSHSDSRMMVFMAKQKRRRRSLEVTKGRDVTFKFFNTLQIFSFFSPIKSPDLILMYSFTYLLHNDVTPACYF